ncbi:MAG: type II toxin-antitoxin system VapC family toxin [Thermoanaerobaculia bacterium]|nr:type II toxin-antitoxin system VapC family toxin [Thermoanaerobaculia bacterium]
MRPRIYTDTSAIGGCIDVEFSRPSSQLFEWFRKGQAVLVISDLTLLELQEAPEAVQSLVETVPPEHREMVSFNDQANELAEMYLAEKVIGASSLNDARHIATATVHAVTVLVSWNFKHIVNLRRIHGYNSINVRYGFPMLEIRTPKEVVEYDE